MDGNEPILIALISALGIKEIWNIIKKRMDHSASKDERQDKLSVQVMIELKDKISSLEKRVDILVDENINLKVKIARMEERLIKNAKNHAKKKLL